MNYLANDKTASKQQHGSLAPKQIALKADCNVKLKISNCAPITEATVTCHLVLPKNRLGEDTDPGVWRCSSPGESAATRKTPEAEL